MPQAKSLSLDPIFENLVKIVNQNKHYSQMEQYDYKFKAWGRSVL